MYNEKETDFSALVLLFVLTTSAYAEHEKEYIQFTKTSNLYEHHNKCWILLINNLMKYHIFKEMGLAGATDGKQFIKYTSYSFYKSRNKNIYCQ